MVKSCAIDCRERRQWTTALLKGAHSRFQVGLNKHDAQTKKTRRPKLAGSIQFKESWRRQVLLYGTTLGLSSLLLL
jgi:hypothetical protein